MNAVQLASQKNVSLIGDFAEKYGIEPEKLLPVLKATAFRVKDKEVSNEQLAALMIVSNRYNLNPFVKEIYAFPNKMGGIEPVISVDGWNNLMQSNPNFDGIEFKYSEKTIKADADAKECPEWIEAVIYKKGCTKPLIIREWLDECYRGKSAYGGNFGPWQTHTRRMLRHKAMIQAARMAFGFAGIYDEDEAQRIVEATEHTVVPAPQLSPPPAPPVEPPQEPTRRGRKPKGATADQTQAPAAPLDLQTATAPAATATPEPEPEAPAPEITPPEGAALPMFE